MNRPLRVLIVEDLEDDALLLLRQLKRGGYDPLHLRVETAEAMKSAVREEQWDAILADYAMPTFNALAALDVVREAGLDLPFIIVSGTIGEQTAVEAMKAGAHDYLMKDNLSRLAPAIERELREAKIREERRRAQEALKKAHAELEERVTERTAELQRSKDTVEALLNATMEMAFLLDTNGNLLALNETVSREFGLQIADLLGKSPFALMPDSVGQARRERFEQVIRSGSAVRFEDEESGRVTDHTYYPVIGDHGSVEAVAVFAHDITDRKSMEAELKKAYDKLEERVRERTRELNELNEILMQEVAERKRAEENYRSIFENAVEGIFQSTPDGRFLTVNPAMARTLGYDSPEDLIANTSDMAHQLYVDPERRAEFMRLMQGQEAAPTFEAELYRKNRDTIWASIHARPIYSEQGELLCIEGILEDISERKRAEEELAKAQALLVAAIEHTPAGILIADGPDGRIRVANSAALGIRGDTTLPLTDIPLERHADHWQTYHPDGTPFRPEELPLAQAVLHGATSKNVDVIIRHADGDERWVLSNAAPVRNADGEIIAGVSVFPDITERKRLEEQLRQAAKMEAIGQLAGGVAHDFNNLLTAIMGYTDMLLQQLPKDGLYHQRLSQISRAARSAAALVRQLLAFSRKAVLDVALLDLNRAVEDFSRIIERLIGEGIELTTFLDPGLGMVRADPGQIEQILMNLAVNARDAMPRGGTLTVQTANVDLDEEHARTLAEVEPGQYVSLTVSDTGEGMDPETLSHIFDPFFTTKEKGVGTGLGLSTVYGVVKQHQGHIVVDSEPGRGTSFKVYLPRLAEAAPVLDRTPTNQRPLQGNETVLIVEDERVVRNLACDGLEALGYRILQAGSPEEAIEVSGQHQDPIQLLLTDVVLPRMDGRTLFRRLSSTRPDMKVLYVSGYTEEFIVGRGVLDSGVQFLQKPFNVDSLACKVREVLEES